MLFCFLFVCSFFFFLSLEGLDKIVTTHHNHSNSVHRVIGSLALVINNNVSLSKRTSELLICFCRSAFLPFKQVYVSIKNVLTQSIFMILCRVVCFLP